MPRRFWTAGEVLRLSHMVRAGLSAAQAGLVLGRSTPSVWMKMTRSKLRSRINPKGRKG